MFQELAFVRGSISVVKQQREKRKVGGKLVHKTYLAKSCTAGNNTG